MKPNATGRLWLILLGIPPVGWLGLHLAPYMGQGLAGIVAALQQAMVHPFEITIVPNSVRTAAICLAVYALAVGIALSSRKNTRNGEEHGSAKCFDIWNSNRDDANLYKTMMTADETASYSAKYNDLRTYVDQVSNQVIVGEMSIDDWDSVVEAMYNDFGLQELLDICQTAYDRYMES